MSSHLLTKQTKIMIRLDNKKLQPSTKSYKVTLCFKNNQSSTIDRQISLNKSQSILQKMLRQQDELLTASSCRFNQINKEVIEQFLERIRDQVQSNDLYNKLVNKQIILDILEQYRKRYINHQKFTQLIDLILDYMAISKNFMNRASNLLSTSLKLADLPSTMAYRWLRLKSQIYFSNMDYLKILSYFAQDNDFGHSFTSLPFNFTKQQIRKVAKIVKELCSYDIRAFSLLTNYLYICCHKLQRNGENINDIQNRLINTLKMLDDENLPAPPFQGNYEQANFHKDYKASRQQYLIKCIDVSSIQPKYKILALEGYIERRIADAIESFYSFNQLVKGVCIEYGYHYRSSLKLKDKTERMALNRVVEKIVSDYLPGKLRKSQIVNFKGSIEELAELQYSQYQQKLKQIIGSTNIPIQFKVSDLLRSKCMFATVQKLNKCLSQLKQRAKDCGWKIVQIKNRLRKRTTDILIKLGKGQVLGEIQLALDFKVAQNQFNHKIYELRRTQMFSPLAMLYQLNKRLTNNFIRQLHGVLKANTRLTSINDYSQLHTFHEVQKYFSKFISIIPINLDFSKSHRNQIDVNLMGTQIKKLGIIINYKIEQTPIVNKIEKIRRNGQFYYELKRYEEAEKWLHNYCEIFRSQHKSLINRLNPQGKQLITTWHCVKKDDYIGSTIILEKHEKILIKKYVQVLNLLSKVYMDMANYDKSTDLCFNCREILQKINVDRNDQILLQLQKNIGWNEFQRGNYITAIQSYSNFLSKIEDTKGIEDINYGMTLNYIGIIHEKTGNYDESINYYTRGLAIIEGSKGKYSSQYASILQNLGLTYLNQGHYSKAIEIFQKCLEISQKIMGKDSINCAQTLNNIGNVYNRMGNSQQAMSYYKKCLSIQQKVKGVQYIDYAKILGNIGLLFYNDYEYEQALKYYRKCLSIKEKILGKKNIELVYTLNNIGIVLTSQGQYQQALKFYERCITIQKLSRNNTTIEYSNTLNNMAMIFKQTGEYFKAADYLQQGLKIVQSIEGNQCMDYAFLMQSLGEIYYEQDNYDYALVHFQIALQIFQSFQGRDSIDYVNVLSYCAGVKCRLGQYDQAIQMSEAALKIKRKINEKNKLGYIFDLNNIGLSWYRKGNQQKALNYYLSALEICEKRNVQFSQYGHTCLGISNIYKLTDQGKYQKYYERGMKIFKRLKPKLYEKLKQQEQKQQ